MNRILKYIFEPALYANGELRSEFLDKCYRSLKSLSDHEGRFKQENSLNIFRAYGTTCIEGNVQKKFSSKT